ncbi:hypothetical protein M9H77_03325 [Catharanthus roseus]|uniref:Uncharacterized protein n=1 Tax=Catharanthus roseus TaxID=4058 RepID=A0ACC0CB38_CATRO|nr:hypothetical protein M9H77_03325 [Catharanthus roseus]
MKFESFLLGFKISKSNMEDELRHVQQAWEGLEQQLSSLGKGVKDLKIEEEAILEQSSRIQCIIINRDMVTFLLMLDLMSMILMIAMRAIDLELELVIMIELIIEFQGIKLKMDESFHKRRGDVERCRDSYNHYQHNSGRQKQGQAKEKFMEFSMGEKSTKVDDLSKAQDIVDRKVIHDEKNNTCTFVKEESQERKK